MRKHYVLGLVFNRLKDHVLLGQKKRPDWMKDRWNGIGGKIEGEEEPLMAMQRECFEEIGTVYEWKHKITFTSPGGTVFVFASESDWAAIDFHQMEDEHLAEFALNKLPKTMMVNLEWIIPLCLANLTFPIMIDQTNLGIER